MYHISMKGRSRPNGTHTGVSWVDYDPLMAKEHILDFLTEWVYGWGLICLGDGSAYPLWYFEKSPGEAPKLTQLHMARF